MAHQGIRDYFEWLYGKLGGQPRQGLDYEQLQAQLPTEPKARIARLQQALDLREWVDVYWVHKPAGEYPPDSKEALTAFESGTEPQQSHAAMWRGEDCYILEQRSLMEEFEIGALRQELVDLESNYLLHRRNYEIQQRAAPGGEELFAKWMGATDAPNFEVLSAMLQSDPASQLTALSEILQELTAHNEQIKKRNAEKLRPRIDSVDLGKEWTTVVSVPGLELERELDAECDRLRAMIAIAEADAARPEQVWRQWFEDAAQFKTARFDFDLLQELLPNPVKEPGERKRVLRHIRTRLRAALQELEDDPQIILSLDYQLHGLKSHPYARALRMIESMIAVPSAESAPPVSDATTESLTPQTDDRNAASSGSSESRPVDALRAIYETLCSAGYLQSEETSYDTFRRGLDGQCVVNFNGGKNALAPLLEYLQEQGYTSYDTARFAPKPRNSEAPRVAMKRADILTTLRKIRSERDENQIEPRIERLLGSWKASSQ